MYPFDTSVWDFFTNLTRFCGGFRFLRGFSNVRFSTHCGFHESSGFFRWILIVKVDILLRERGISGVRFEKSSDSFITSLCSFFFNIFQYRFFGFW